MANHGVALRVDHATVRKPRALTFEDAREPVFVPDRIEFDGDIGGNLDPQRVAVAAEDLAMVAFDNGADAISAGLEIRHRFNVP